MHHYSRTLPACAFAFALMLLGCSSDENNSVTEVPEPPAVDVDAAALQTVIDDMSEPHEGFPRGVIENGGSAWDWVYRPRVGYGNDLPDGWDATIPWGQVYADTSGLASPDTRFQIRRLRQYMLSKSDRAWSLVVDEPNEIAGANYAEDFQEDDSVDADLRREGVSAGGGISANIIPAHNFHFFARSRVRVDPRDVAGMLTVFEARLVPGTPRPEGSSHLLASAGGDYWESLAAQWDQWRTNGDWAIGRFKYLTPEWQLFSAHTVDEEILRRTPPPL